MEAISRTLFNLLAQRQTVILPQLGTLRVERDTAAFGQAAGSLSVPSNRVIFLASKEEGETLPEQIARITGKTVKEIQPLYNRWITGIKSTADHGKMEIEGVGLIRRQPDGSYRFETAPELDKLLNPLDVKTIQVPVLKPAKTAEKPARKTPASAGSPPSAGQEKPSGKGRAAGLAAGAALAAVLVCGGYYAYTRGFFDTRPDNTPEKHTEQPVSRPQTPPRETEKPPVTADTAGITPVPEPTSLSPANTAQPETPPQTLPEGYTGEVYHIIAGVFSTRENAERFVSENAFSPALTTLIPTTGGRYMVSVGKFTGKEEADREMDRLRARIPQAWVSKRKK